MPHKFTSLQSTIEKLLEAEYFLANLAKSQAPEFGYNLNAFLAACRSVTLVLQKTFSKIDAFNTWYDQSRKNMKADPTMGFFLELRNISQHEGPVSYVGGSILQPPGWSYRFAGNRESVPKTLLGRDIASACADQLAKISTLVDQFKTTFPYASCLHDALTPDGMKQLGYSLDDVGALLGFPPGYLDVGDDIPLEEKLRILRGEFDPIDADAVARMVQGRFHQNDEELTFATSTGTDLIDDIALLIEQNDARARTPRMAFVTAIAQRIDEIEKNNRN